MSIRVLPVLLSYICRYMKYMFNDSKLKQRVSVKVFKKKSWTEYPFQDYEPYLLSSQRCFSIVKVKQNTYLVTDARILQLWFISLLFYPLVCLCLIELKCSGLVTLLYYKAECYCLIIGQLCVFVSVKAC